MFNRALNGDQSETARLTSLLCLEVLDTPPERHFDEVTRLAALACGTGSAAITMVDVDRIWSKSQIQAAIEVPRQHGLCGLEIDRGGVLIIPDTLLDDRCKGNPLTECSDGIRFYAGAPLITSSGHCVGRLCVFDKAPRAGLTDGQVSALTSLSRMVVEMMENSRLRQIGRIAEKVADVTSDAIVCADGNGSIVFWNSAAEGMFGHQAKDALGRSLEIIVPHDLRRAHAIGFTKVAAGGPTKLTGATVEVLAMRSDGTTFPVELSVGQWKDGGSIAFAAIIRDVSERKLLESEREQAKVFLDTVIDHLPAMLFVKDASTQQYVLMNKVGAELAGCAEEDFIGRTDSELSLNRGIASYEHDRAAAGDAGVQTFESDYVRSDGRRLRLRSKRVAFNAQQSGRRYLLGMDEDVTEARRAQEEIRRLAEYDSLTGLRNRASFVARLEALARADMPFTLLSIDLDRFKAVNDQFGHLIGDEVLKIAGARLGHLVGRDDMASRIGGDEFAIILSGATSADRARHLAPLIIVALEAPMLVGDTRAFVGASVGGASYPSDGDTPSSLRQAADLALYRAKEGGCGTSCFYDQELDASLRERRQLEQALRKALEQDDIDVVFQPVFSLETGAVTSFEALARWSHPIKGAISPGDFVPLAEESGLIEQLGTQVLTKACRRAVDWPDDIPVAVNLSPLQFLTGKLCDCVHEVLRESRLPPARLQLEVTEGLLIRDVERTFQQLEQLRALGIKILMDDFGVGYSSLSYFQRFPFDKVKIDRSFVDTVSDTLAAQAIVKAVVQVGSTLGMAVVAEGVETTQQMDILALLGCTHAQGFLLGRPMHGSAATKLVTDSTTARKH